MLYAFEGDGNGRTWEDNGSLRTSQIMDLRNQQFAPGSVFAAGPIDWANITQQYEKATSLDENLLRTETAKQDWELGIPLQTAWGVPFNHGDGCSGHNIDATTVSILCDLDTPNGVYPAWMDPDIEYRFTMTFGFTASTLVNYSISGCNKLFPAYEIWASGELIHASPDSGNPLDIFVPCELAEPLEKTGTVTLS